VKNSQNVIMFIIVLGKHISIPIEGPEDDSIRIETCYPNTIINIIKFWLCLTDTSLYIYTCFGVNLYARLHGAKCSIIFRPLGMRLLGCLQTLYADYQVTRRSEAQ